MESDAILNLSTKWNPCVNASCFERSPYSTFTERVTMIGEYVVVVYCPWYVVEDFSNMVIEWNDLRFGFLAKLWGQTEEIIFQIHVRPPEPKKFAHPHPRVVSYHYDSLEVPRRYGNYFEILRHEYDPSPCIATWFELPLHVSEGF